MRSGRGIVHGWEQFCSRWNQVCQGLSCHLGQDGVDTDPQSRTSAQSAELLASTQALCWGKFKAITVCMDSQYACATAYVRGLRKQNSRLGHLDGDPRTNGACQNLGYPD